MIGTLQAILKRYPPSCRPTRSPEPLGNAGGFSGARLWRFDSGRGPLVLRCWPEDGPELAHLEQIHAWLRDSASLGFVTVPIPALDGRTVVSTSSRLWSVEPWMPGTADLSRPPTDPHLRAAFTGLAAFHARLALNRFEGPSPGLSARVVEIERLILGNFDSIRSVLDRAPIEPSLPLARRWLDLAVRLAPGIVTLLRKVLASPVPLQPCLRDARPDHFLFVGDRLSGLIDFGAMGRDSVAGDLARLLAEGVGPDRVARSEALSGYESIRPLSEAERRLMGAFERANALLGAGRWVRWHFIEGRRFDDPDAVLRGLRRGLERLEEAEPSAKIRHPFTPE